MGMIGAINAGLGSGIKPKSLSVTRNGLPFAQFSTAFGAENS